ncbi:MAG: VOC family protein [Candidatus Heimdallarchaeota archaeon]|nr:VOC family protein [Candidatus Heimdallarchaeota archaeon]MCK4878153.1 VOC family protein [Candidatus Heimdallarchaeota archaeon]
MILDFVQAQKEVKETGLSDLIIKLDHVAYRVKKGKREKTMVELANLVPYQEFKTFKVISMNAITSSIKLHDSLPVIVVSEGLTEDSVVEKYVKKYGGRIHHLAYLVTDIDKVVEIQRKRGVKFTTDYTIGSEEEGIKQIFTLPTETANHIIEYIQRFGDFDGFFTPSNIGSLMKSTEKLSEA